jgi:trk system potassium uptake protein TrkA
MKIVIQGAGEVGSHLAKMLSREDNDITVIDDSAQRLHSITEIADVIAVEGPPSSLKVMREAEVQHADLFISVVPFVPQDVNIVSALLAKNLGAAKVTARIDDNDFLTPENKLLFKQMGIELMFYPERLASDEIFELLKHSSSSESMDFARGRLQVEVFKLEEDSPLLDMKIAEFAAGRENVTCAEVEAEFGISNHKAAAILNRSGKFIKVVEGKGKVKSAWAVA